MTTDAARLQSLQVFRSLPTEALDELAALCRERAVEDGGFYFMQGDEARYMYVLTEGRVKLTQIAADGQQVGLHMVGPGDLFAGVALLNPKAGYPVSAQALEDSSALAWSGEDLRGLAPRYPGLSLEIMAVMRSHVEEMHNRYSELSTERVERRLARALLRLTARLGRKLAGGAIELSISQQDLAEMSGTTLFSVSRTFAEWERQGWLETGRERLVIRDPHSLVKIAEDLPD